MDLLIPGPAGSLEATLWMPRDGAAPRAACAFCHPHPEFGGTMDNTVVFRAARGLQQAGLAVLRFNFRGVGRSQGAHGGQGGYEGEEGDLGAALDQLEARLPGVELWAGGFSFGSRIAASRARKDARVARLVLVALPVGAFELGFLREVRTPGLILMAGRDEYGTLEVLKERFPDLYPGLQTDEIPDVNHFFHGATGELQSRVRAWAERALGRQA